MREFAAEQAVNWYVSRRVDVPSDEIREVTLPEVVVASNGVSLTIGDAIPVDDDEYRCFDALLTFPRVLAGKIRVELDLNPYSSRFVELGLRPARHAPRLLLGAQQYFDGAWSVLDALAAELAAVEEGEGRAA